MVRNMGSADLSLSRKRVYGIPEMSLAPPTNFGSVQFHEVGTGHVFYNWDVSARVFLKGNVRTSVHGYINIRIVLVDEEGSKMEAVASGEHCRIIDRLVFEGESYKFSGVGFAPTFVDPDQWMFRLCNDYYLVLLPYTEICNPGTLWIPVFPLSFTEFEDLYRRPLDTFSDIIGVVIYMTKIQYRSNSRQRPFRYVVIMNSRSKLIVINVKSKQLTKHMWRWTNTACEFRILAAIHMKTTIKSNCLLHGQRLCPCVVCGVTTVAHSELHFTPICSDYHYLNQGLRTDILGEPSRVRDLGRVAVSHMMGASHRFHAN